ncbi:unnamed protein product [Lactuca saligna]|uniref:Uncharacterized protein n=1 Tax=Lactuca saligna TaxID=75948 RepID=A0AA35Y5H6_LACSI|nr:unnamed protein product [Lactuca saligna]
MRKDGDRLPFVYVILWKGKFRHEILALMTLTCMPTFDDNLNDSGNEGSNFGDVEDDTEETSLFVRVHCADDDDVGEKTPNIDIASIFVNNDENGNGGDERESFICHTRDRGSITYVALAAVSSGGDDSSGVGNKAEFLVQDASEEKQDTRQCSLTRVGRASYGTNRGEDGSDSWSIDWMDGRTNESRRSKVSNSFAGVK